MNKLRYIISKRLFGAAFFMAAILTGCGDAGYDISIPEPQNPRQDVRYGYYLSTAEQPQETRDHVNLHWEAFWEGTDKAVENMRYMQAGPHPADVVLDVSSALFNSDEGQNLRFKADPEASLRGLLQALQTGWVLHRVKVIAPADEPNLPATGATDLIPEAVRIIRAVAAEFPELAGVKVGVVYYYKGFPHKELFDVVGFNDYPAQSSIFDLRGSYTKLKQSLREDQQTWIFPGASYGQDPAPFVNYALGNDEVYAVVPFLWRHPIPDSGDVGVRDTELKGAYVEAGKTILGVSP